MLNWTPNHKLRAVRLYGSLCPKDCLLLLHRAGEDRSDILLTHSFFLSIVFAPATAPPPPPPPPVGPIRSLLIALGKEEVGSDGDAQWKQRSWNKGSSTPWWRRYNKPCTRQKGGPYRWEPRGKRDNTAATTARLAALLKASFPVFISGL